MHGTQCKQYTGMQCWDLYQPCALHSIAQLAAAIQRGHGYAVRPRACKAHLPCPEPHAGNTRAPRPPPPAPPHLLRSEAACTTVSRSCGARSTKSRTRNSRSRSGVWREAGAQGSGNRGQGRVRAG